MRSFKPSPIFAEACFISVSMALLSYSLAIGGALIFFTVYLLMLFVVSADVLFPAAALLSGSLAALLAYRYSGHIKDRVLAWQNPFSCIEDEGYQMARSLFAIGNGEWFGTGLGNGMPKTVPVVKSDFIFAGIHTNPADTMIICHDVLHSLQQFFSIHLRQRCFIFCLNFFHADFPEETAHGIFPILQTSCCRLEAASAIYAKQRLAAENACVIVFQTA